MKVKVTGPYQVVHDEKIYTEGDTLDAPDAEARQWLAAGYVEEVKAPAKAAEPTAKKSSEGKK